MVSHSNLVSQIFWLTFLYVYVLIAGRDTSAFLSMEENCITCSTVIFCFVTFCYIALKHGSSNSNHKYEIMTFKTSHNCYLNYVIQHRVERSQPSLDLQRSVRGQKMCQESNAITLS